jgi:hypothetical protein
VIVAILSSDVKPEAQHTEASAIESDHDSDVDARLTDFSATLEESAGVMVVEDLRVMANGSIALIGRDSLMPQRPKSR